MADAVLTGSPDNHPSTAQIARAIREARANRGKRSAFLKHIFLIATSLVMIYPLIWMLASSLKPDNQIFGNLGLWPSEFVWQNYADGWNIMAVSFTRFFLNSTFVTVLSVIGNVIWVVVLGWELALGHLIAGLLLCVTIIGIPFGVACWKMIPLALLPLGREVVPIRSVGHDPYGVPVSTQSA